MAKIDIFEVRWCDIVFLGRNTSFGAYVLRTQSSKRHLKALLIASLFFLLAVSSPILIKSLKKEDIKPVIGPNNTKEIVVEPKKKQNDKFIPPPPPEIPKVKSIAFPPPVVARDKDVPEEASLVQKDVVKSDDKISTETNKTGVENAFQITQGGDSHESLNTNTDDVVVEDVQVPPSPKGGYAQLYKWLSDHIEYPTLAKENGIIGTVQIQFVVGKNGQIRDVKVTKGAHALLDAEAERVVKMMPAWNPGQNNGKDVTCRYYLPVQFKLPNADEE